MNTQAWVCVYVMCTYVMCASMCMCMCMYVIQCVCGSPVLKLKIIPLHISVASPCSKRGITKLLQRVGLICAF